MLDGPRHVWTRDHSAFANGAVRSGTMVVRGHCHVWASLCYSGRGPGQSGGSSHGRRALYHGGLLVYGLNILCQSGGYIGAYAVRYICGHKAHRCPGLYRCANGCRRISGWCLPHDLRDTKILERLPVQKFIKGVKKLPAHLIAFQKDFMQSPGHDHIIYARSLCETFIGRRLDYRITPSGHN